MRNKLTPDPVPQLGAISPMLEVAAQLRDCQALRCKRWIQGSSTLIHTMGLASHHDIQKDWDSLKTLYYLTTHCKPEEPILDAGSGANSVILRWLHRLGYCNLWACDRVDVDTSRYSRVGIRFSKQDMASTNYEEQQFASISCISVIEHGVEPEHFFQEMSRILKPGGVLCVSTDYWETPVDCAGIYPYGVEFGEMKIFTREEIESLAEGAAKFGLELCTALDSRVEERAIRWDRVNREYTFLFMAFRKA